MNERLLLAFLFALLSSFTWGQGGPCGSVSISNADTLQICEGDIVELRQTNTLSNPTFRWAPAEGFLDPVTDASPRVQPAFSGYYRVTASDLSGCSVSDSIYIDVDRLVVPSLIGPTTVCQGTPTDLLTQAVDDVGDSRYILLRGQDTLSQSRDPNFTVRPDRRSTYTLISLSDNGSCENRQSVTINVTPGFLDIPQDTVFACRGLDSIVLTVIDTPSMERTITWSPSRFNLSPPTGNTYTVRPVADITYFVEATINGCQLIDSVAIRLDSLPEDLSLTVDPEKDPYCQGDTIIVRSPVYDAGDFPLITHDWAGSLGLQSPRDLYNAVFTAQDTTVLRRITVNGGCRDTAEVAINVITPPVITFEPADPIVCAGEPVQITATFTSGSGSLTWTDPGGTLSCTECLDPVATVNTTTEYAIKVQTGDSQCSSDLTYTVRVQPVIEPTLTEEITLCPGESRQLIVGNTVAGYTYRITGGGVDLNDPTASVTPTETTTYTITSTGDCGTASQTITLIVANNYSVEATAPSTVCAGENLTLSAAPTPAGITGTYVWLLPNGTSRSGQEISVQDPQTGTYTVTFTDARGCSTATDAVEVEVLGQTVIPVITATLVDGTTVTSGAGLFAGNDVILRVTNVPAGLNFTYEWSGNYTPATATGEEIFVSVPRSSGQPQPLSYTVTLTSDQGSCTFQATIVLPVEQSRVEAPDFFTPDNDGRNDLFRLFFNGQITDYTMIVYNRWGQKVFTSDDPLEGWDGTKDGTPQTADVYLYLAKFRQDGVELQKDGQVSLVR
ncbi:gliding motility-associated C-terminal domain-containing protein [Lewinella sp. JB7]|uniref:T9SS type B sorting domain-containing protein n=1 Tax=Lewinella sp. JB7 TaxID=2962887 RepID=UPI0020C98D3C|nr:gliding motility-associated C-terminal domain-containing protein [Lewinella sp. JB7]MCP9235325.1 gliding motility-associated C-terminal domain-containing protein [Lewinella sp. JB7]